MTDFSTTTFSSEHAVLRKGRFLIHVLPRQTIPWDLLPENAVAMDGIVLGGPQFDPKRHCVNLDHHDGVVREATMSTCMQTLFAIKGGLLEMFAPHADVHVFINDTDQDTSLAVWLLIHHKLFEGTRGIPSVNRLIALTDRLDITGGAFPMDLNDDLLAHHGWVFELYARFRTTGALATADAFSMIGNLEGTLGRLNDFMMGNAGTIELNTQHKVLFDHPQFKIVDEIGGNDARYHLFSHGMNAFVSIVAHRPDGRLVVSVGRRSRYIPFPVPQLFDHFNTAEGRTRVNGFNGSDIIGGSSRLDGTGHRWEDLRDLTLEVLGESPRVTTSFASHSS